MWKLLKVELKRGFINLRFPFAVILGFALCYYGLMDYKSLNYPVNIQYYQNAYQAWFDSLGNGPKAFYILVVPLLCVLPYADSFLKDKSSGHIRNIIHRVSYKKFIGSKILANGIVSGFTIFLTLGLFFVYCCFLYPAKLPNLPPEQWGNVPRGMFSNIFLTTPRVYIFINLVQAFIFGFVFSTFGFAFSFLNIRKQLVFIIPEVLYIVMNLIKEIFELKHFYSVQLLFPWTSAITNVSTVILEFSIILIISFIIVYKGKGEIY
jgi:hypothetical protein